MVGDVEGFGQGLPMVPGCCPDLPIWISSIIVLAHESTTALIRLPIVVDVHGKFAHPKN